jgi:hypothetical protein
VNLSVLELVLFFAVEDDAVLVDEAHHGGLPPGRAEEVDNYVEEPVLEG